MNNKLFLTKYNKLIDRGEKITDINWKFDTLGKV